MSVPHVTRQCCFTIFAPDHYRNRLPIPDCWAPTFSSPPEFGVGDATAHCPSHILSYRYKKEGSVTFMAFKIHQNPYSVGAPAHYAPRPSSRLEKGHVLSPYPTPLGSDPPSALAMHPPEFQPYLRLCIIIIFVHLASGATRGGANFKKHLVNEVGKW